MHTCRHRRRGFTLIELLVVLAIAGILASFVYPSYAAHLIRAHRLEGKLALIEAMQRQEMIYSRSNRYAAFSADSAGSGGAGGADGTGGALPPGGWRWWSGASAAASYYELHAQPCAGGADLARCVEVVATPGTARVDARFRDPACGVLTLVSTGEQRAASGDPACWP